ncbi:MAG: hypothetical protein II997_04485 [Clostridia bacterium]|nr:hypothetical protein [Clostridia bacterium]
MVKFKNIRKNLITVIFLVFIFGMSADYCLNVVSALINTNKISEKTEYKEEFFELKEQLTSNNSVTTRKNKETSLVDELLDFYKEKTNSLSNFNNLVLKDFFLNLNAGLCRNMGISYIPGTTFLKHTDGSLISVDKNYIVDKEKLRLHVGFLNNFKQELDKKGIGSVYVNCPNKELLMGNKLPLGFINHSKYDENKYMKEILAENDIKLLDLSEKMIENDEDVMKLFYKTDHHWKTEHGVKAAKYISEYLNYKHNYGIDTGIFDMANYDVEVYEKCLLGSTGINATEAFVEAENFDTYIPKSKNEFSFEIPSKNVDLEGEFDIFINEEKLDNKKTWPFNAYASYIYANSAYLKIENKTIKDEHKVLIIKDSFANVIVPYLAQVIKRVDVIDMRKSQTDHFNGDIMSLVEKNNYDTVLFIYNDFSYEYDRLFLK